jgi:hypothetical protein
MEESGGGNRRAGKECMEGKMKSAERRAEDAKKKQDIPEVFYEA